MHIALQVIFNVCVVLNVIPTTGITLPFISYGGTSILFLMVEIGLALGVSNQIPANAGEVHALEKKDATDRRKSRKKTLRQRGNIRTKGKRTAG